MTALLRLEKICFGYPGGRTILDGAGLELGAGERLCVKGPNGSGKSTLLRIMVGLLHPFSGSVWAFGAERRTEDDFHAVRCRAGLVFQEPDDQLFCPTVREDIAFGPLNLGKSRQEAEAVVEEVLEGLALTHLASRITHKLSGGEKRLVTLATVLAMKPDVLLLDEPTNALDEENEARLTEILLSLPLAMVVVSHDPAFRARMATRSLALKEGRLVEASA
ncbi:energy-coupling factor ABC transporter ATP-binding protein [Xanthobacter sp. TB0139]|uniref:energy-coupling factor ABC transporter ATP-binding protein n=1 Tax=Xanthobacter sp. TB0139 TaxID=3459178 RepID=UPI00403988B9